MFKNKKGRKGIKAVFGVVIAMFTVLILTLPVAVKSIQTDVFHDSDIKLFSTDAEIEAYQGELDACLEKEKAVISELEKIKRKVKAMEEEGASEEETAELMKMYEDYNSKLNAHNCDEIKSELEKAKREMKEQEKKEQEAKEQAEQEAKEQAEQVENASENTNGTSAQDEPAPADVQEQPAKIIDLVTKDVRLENGIMTFEITNRGQHVLDMPVHFYTWVDGELDRTYLTKTLASQDFRKPGGVTKIMTKPLPEGVHKVRACVDANDVIPEFDEGNNCMARELGEQIYDDGENDEEIYDDGGGSEIYDDGEVANPTHGGGGQDTPDYGKLEPMPYNPQSGNDECDDYQEKIDRLNEKLKFAKDLEDIRRLEQEIRTAQTQADRFCEDEPINVPPPIRVDECSEYQSKIEALKLKLNQTSDIETVKRMKDDIRNLQTKADRFCPEEVDECSEYQKEIETLKKKLGFAKDVEDRQRLKGLIRTKQTQADRFCPGDPINVPPPSRGEDSGWNGQFEPAPRPPVDNYMDPDAHMSGGTNVHEYEGEVITNDDYKDDKYENHRGDKYEDDHYDKFQEEEDDRWEEENDRRREEDVERRKGDLERFSHLKEQIDKMVYELKREYEILEKDLEREDKRSGLKKIIATVGKLVNEAGDMKAEFGKKLRECKSMVDSDDGSYDKCTAGLDMFHVRQSLIWIKMDYAHLSSEHEEYKLRAGEYAKDAERAGVTPDPAVEKNLKKLTSLVAEVASMKDKMSVMANTAPAAGEDLHDSMKDFWNMQDSLRKKIDNYRDSRPWDILDKAWRELGDDRKGGFHDDGFKGVRQDIQHMAEWLKGLQNEGKDIGKTLGFISNAFDLIKAGEKALEKQDFETVDKVWEKMDHLGKAFKKEIDRLGLEPPFGDKGPKDDKRGDRPDKGPERPDKYEDDAASVGFAPSMDDIKEHASGDAGKIIENMSGDEARELLKKLISANEVTVDTLARLKEIKGVDAKVRDRSMKNVKDLDKYVSRKEALLNESEVLFEKLDKEKGARQDIGKIKDMIYSYNFSDEVNEKVLAKAKDFIVRYEQGDITSTDITNFKKWLESLKEESRMDKYESGEIPFKDADDDEWYYEYMKKMNEEGAIKGYPDGTAKPGNNANGAEVAKIISELFLGGPASGISGEWYEKYAVQMKRSEIQLPADLGAPVTRGYLAYAIHAALNPDMTDVPDAQVFTDVPSGHMAYKAVAWMAHYEIIDTGDKFRVNDTTNRAEVSKVLKNVLEIVGLENFDL